MMNRLERYCCDFVKKGSEGGKKSGVKSRAVELFGL